MSDFAAKVIRWQKKHGRHDLPWQKTRNAYRIWLSEIMLQQTQVATVIPYYHRFLKSFPTFEALARAPLNRVLKQWEGLGYYSRARNLHALAKQVVKQHRGKMPRTFDEALALPGIGRLLIGAIYTRDFVILQGVVLFVAAGFVIVNFLVDVLYAMLDPRIRHGRA